MVAQVPAQQPANQSVVAPFGANSSSVNILMVDYVDLTTRAKNYDKQPEGESSTHTDSPSMPHSNGPLTLEKPTFEALSHPSKRALQCANCQHYNIIEYLAQALCAMLALEVLHSFPTQRKALLNAIGAVDSADTSHLYFDPKNSEPCLPQL